MTQIDNDVHFTEQDFPLKMSFQSSVYCAIFVVRSDRRLHKVCSLSHLHVEQRLNTEDQI